MSKANTREGKLKRKNAEQNQLSMQELNRATFLRSLWLNSIDPRLIARVLRHELADTELQARLKENERIEQEKNANDSRIKIRRITIVTGDSEQGQE
jgi:hypothetical protein